MTETRMRSACDFIQSGTARSGRRGVGTLLIISSISYAMAIAGCARHTVPSDSKTHTVQEAASEHRQEAAPAQRQAAAPAHRQAEPRIRRIKRALLAPQPAPDCEFRGADQETVDPEIWARLKLDYERRCYRKAEMVVRKRLALLQASSRQCEIVPIRRPSGSGLAISLNAGDLTRRHFEIQ